MIWHHSERVTQPWDSFFLTTAMSSSLKKKVQLASCVSEEVVLVFTLSGWGLSHDRGKLAGGKLAHDKIGGEKCT